MENPHRFKVGDRVVIVKSPDHDRVGEVCTVTGYPTPVKFGPEAWHWQEGELAPGTPIYPINAKSIRVGCEVAYPASHLEPYRPDHNERADLSAMPEWIRRLTKQRERA
ncbi:MAG TPA: hypothetical protein VGK73_19130 [Polyangiaceae bacterium]